MQRTILTVVCLVLIGLVAAFGTWQLALAAPDPPMVTSVPTPVLKVRTARWALGAPGRTVTAQGRLEARSRSPLLPEASGPLVWVHEAWSPGKRVPQGAPLWKLDDTALRLELQRVAARRAVLESQLKRAEWSGARAQRTATLESERVEVLSAEVERWQALLAEGRGTQSALDQAKVASLGARRVLLDAEETRRGAELEAESIRAQMLELTVEEDLLHDRLRRLEGAAPMEGLLVGTAPAVGQWVQQGQPLGSVQATESPRILCEVSEDHWSRLTLQSEARVEWLGGRHRIPARVGSLGTEFAPQTGEVTIELVFQDKPPAWRPGQAVRIEFAEQPRERGVWIAAEHLVWKQGQAGVYRFIAEGEDGTRATDEATRVPQPGDSGRARFAPLELGPEEGGLYPVLSGASLGETWIQSPLDRLFEGALVRIVSEEPTR